MSLAFFSSVAIPHSAMFTDYYFFDESNGGHGLTQEREKALVNIEAVTSCIDGNANGYPCNNVDLLAFMPKEEMGAGTASLNDIWGWTNPETGSEIAIVGRTSGTSFVDVTVPTDPVFLGFLPAHSGGSTSWRDVKVYQDHAFIVSELAGDGLQVFDLRTLEDVAPGSTLVETTHFNEFGNAHNIVINNDSGYAYVVGSNTCGQGLFFIDISTPNSPQSSGCFASDGYTHDAQCVIYAGPDEFYRGKEICIAYNEDTVTIVDVSDKTNPIEISRTSYANYGYTHQGWFADESHSIIIVNDELDERDNGNNTRSFIFDVSNLDAPTLLDIYEGPTKAIDHNLYTHEGFVYETNYRAGLRILSTENIESGTLTEVAYFDTIPESNSAQFSGTWSNYPFFESGAIIASDIGNGLFILKANLDGTINPTPTPTPSPAECSEDALDLSAVSIYSSSNTGTFNVSDDGCSITLEGNIWRITDETFTISSNTTLTFTFSTKNTAEIQGIGFDTDTRASASQVFKLTGTQNWGITDYSYTGNGEEQTFTIPVGQYFTGNDMGFVIVNDKDSGATDNIVTVSNVIITQ